MTMTMERRRILTEKVREPQPGLWSNCLVVGNQFFISGQVARDTEGNVVGPGDPLRQSIQALENLKAYVEQAGATMQDILRLGIYLTDIRHRPAFIEARRQFFTGDFPTALLIGDVTLAAPELLVEVEAQGIVGCAQR